MRVGWLSCYFSGVGKCVSLFWGGLSVPRKQGIYMSTHIPLIGQSITCVSPLFMLSLMKKNFVFVLCLLPTKEASIFHQELCANVILE
jgi:hypothetical protein